MRPVVLTQTGIGSTSWVRLDRRASDLNTLIVTRLTSGTATWNLEMTENDPPSGTNFIDPTINQVTASAWVVWNSYVWAYLRLHVTAGTGSVQLTVLQGGP